MADTATWTCPACNTANNDADTQCASCGRARPAPAHDDPAAPPAKPVGYDGQELDIDLEVDRGLPPMIP
jgi:hypothetical protein